jgi:hypothetical protein
VGQFVAFNIGMNFTDPIIGGGFELVYDPSRLRFVSFVWAPDLGDDPGYRIYCPNANDSRCVIFPTQNNVIFNFGSFDVTFQGQKLIGSAIFEALATGPAAVTAVAGDELVGNFYSSVTYEAVVVGYYSASMQVTP